MTNDWMLMALPCPGCERAVLSLAVRGDRIVVEHAEPVCAVFVRKRAEVEALVPIAETPRGYSVDAREFVVVSPLLIGNEAGVKGPPS